MTRRPTVGPGRRRRVRSAVPVDQRFWPKVDQDGSLPADRPELGQCWLWTAATSRGGYGYFGLGTLAEGNRRVVPAHRVAYELTIGPIPESLELDHLCRNRRCVNPVHLEPVTRKENNRRGTSLPAENGRKTHCPNGHPYDLLNTHIGPDGKRYCRACWKLRRAAS